jgi:hypothetical protein
MTQRHDPWHDGSVPRRSSKKGRDFDSVARRVVEEAIGEHLDGTPLEDPDRTKILTLLLLAEWAGKKAEENGRID